MLKLLKILSKYIVTTYILVIFNKEAFNYELCTKSL